MWLSLMPWLAQASCAVVGDSLAVGIGTRLPQCTRLATVGMSSVRFENKELPKLQEGNWSTIVVSLGSNDPTIDRETLGRIRVALKNKNKAQASTYVWVLPRESVKAATLKEWALRQHDQVLTTRDLASKDNLHPTPEGYQTLAKKVCLTGCE
jgi:hypothetical protein